MAKKQMQEQKNTVFGKSTETKPTIAEATIGTLWKESDTGKTYEMRWDSSADSVVWVDVTPASGGGGAVTGSVKIEDGTTAGNKLGVDSNGYITAKEMPNVNLSGSISSAGTIVPSTLVTDYDQYNIHITGTFVSTVSFQGSNDNVNWFGVLGATLTGQWAGNWATTLSSSGIINIPLGFKYIRIVATAYTSGTINLVGELTKSKTVTFSKLDNSQTLQITEASAGISSTVQVLNGGGQSTNVIDTFAAAYNRRKIRFVTTNTMSGGVKIQHSADNSNWFDVPYTQQTHINAMITNVPINNGTPTTSSPVTLECSPQLRYIRLSVYSYSTGALNVYATATGDTSELTNVNLVSSNGNALVGSNLGALSVQGVASTYGTLSNIRPVTMGGAIATVLNSTGSADDNIFIKTTKGGVLLHIDEIPTNRNQISTSSLSSGLTGTVVAASANQFSRIKGIQLYNTTANPITLNIRTASTSGTIIFTGVATQTAPVDTKAVLQTAGVNTGLFYEVLGTTPAGSLNIQGDYTG